MNRFLLIDDEKERIEHYEKLFNFLQLEYLENINDLPIQVQKNFDGYIIDVKLDNDNAKYLGASFKEVLDEVPEGKPIFVVSGKWKEVMNGSEMSCLLKTKKYKNVLGYFSWDKIENNNLSLYQEFAKTQLNNYFGIRSHGIGDDEDFTILQISDLEFGNANQYEFIKSKENEIIANIREDLQVLQTNKQKVDVISVCGDIAHMGKEIEFENAKTWLFSFCNQVLNGDINDGLILVPGNHDFCLDSTLQNYYYYNFSTKTFNKRKNPINDYNYLGFSNYLNFAYEITGKNSKYLENKNYYINLNFIDINIVFIELNPIRYNVQEKKFEYSIYDEDLNNIERELSSFSKEIVFIVVNHVPHESINMIDPTASVVKNELIGFFDRVGINMWMSGHAHTTATIYDARVGRDKRLISRSDSLLVNAVGRCEGSSGGYNLITFKRKNGKIISIDYINEYNKFTSIKYPFD